jgi:hypothetical protein
MQEEQIWTADTIQFLQVAWNELEIKVIQVGWGISEDALGPPEVSDGESDGELKGELDN